jgi:hypothetical protein
VESIFLGFGWVFREQAISDWGIDAHVEVADNKQPTGRLLALQIKSGKSYFKESGDSYIYRGTYRHLHYWKNHSLPVVLVLHDAETKLTVWRRFDLNDVTFHKKRWSIRIPKTNVLDETARQELLKGVSDASVVRKLLLTLDYPLIKKVSVCETFFEIDRHVEETPLTWVTKIYFADFKGKPDAIVTMENEASDIPEFMADVWPGLHSTSTVSTRSCPEASCAQD